MRRYTHSILMSSLLDFFDFFAFIYYCGIPKRCRSCDKRKECRYGILKLRKCKNGCIYAKEQWKLYYERQREDYLNGLMEYMENQEKGRKTKRKEE